MAVFAVIKSNEEYIPLNVVLAFVSSTCILASKSRTTYPLKALPELDTRI